MLIIDLINVLTVGFCASASVDKALGVCSAE